MSRMSASINHVRVAAWAGMLLGLLFLNVLKAQGKGGLKLAQVKVNQQYLQAGVLFAVEQWAVPNNGGLSGFEPFPYLNVRDLSNPNDAESHIRSDHYAWKFAQANDRRGEKGQGVANPASIFKYHLFAEVDGKFYDPSYGIIHASKADMLGKTVKRLVYRRQQAVAEGPIDTDLNGNGNKTDTVNSLVSLFSNPVPAETWGTYMETAGANY